MQVTLIQADILWGEVAKNHCAIEKIISCVTPGSDLYVLPEMFSTGFITEPEGMAEPCDSGGQCESLRWMHRMADKLDAAVAGSVAIKAVDGTYRNRFYFVKPQIKEVEYYDKHHLFTYGGEHHHYTSGHERVIVTWRGVRFLLQICYDLRFPCFSRNTLSALYDAIIYVASWPTSRIEAWHTLLRARAIENQCYVLAVDRIGNDPFCSYIGGTEIIDPYGRLLVSCPDSEPFSLTYSLDLDSLFAFRQKFPVLSDGDEVYDQ